MLWLFARASMTHTVTGGIGPAGTNLLLLVWHLQFYL